MSRNNDRRGGGGCHECGSTNHRVAQCPVRLGRPAAAAGGRCHECGSHNHRVAQCPSRAVAASSVPAAAGGVGGCHECGSHNHRVAQCPSRAAVAAAGGGGCHECGSREHRVAACPKRNGAGAGSAPAIAPAGAGANVCFACQRPGHFAHECPSKSLVPWLPADIKQLVWRLQLGQRWGGSTSYRVDDGNEFACLKRELQEELHRLGLWNKEPSSPDQDAPNRTTHVQLVARHEDLALMAVRLAAIQGRQVPLNEQTVTVETNTVQVDVGDGRHCTLAYQRNLAGTDARRALIRQATITAIRKVAGQQQPQPQPQQAAAEELAPPELDKQCCVCLDAPVETCLVPCGHLCLCTGCVVNIQSSCPICRTNVDKWVKTYSV